MADLGAQHFCPDRSQWNISVSSAFPKQVKDKIGSMHVPGQVGLAVVVVGARVVVVVVGRGVVWGRTCCFLRMGCLGLLF